MKTKYFYLLSLGIALSGCDNSANQAEDNAQSYPVNVPLELRVSSSSSCSPKLDGDTVYVFNAAEEIAGDLACLDVQDMDWSKNSFLTVKIQRFNADSKITKSSLQEVSKGQYLLKVEITPYATQNAAPLYFSMTVPKISKDANIGLSVSVPEGLNAGTFQLKDTQWKLAGYVDVSTGKLTEAEPKECNECYTLSFQTDSLGTGASAGNSVIVDLGKKPFLSLGTEAYHGDIGNAGLFQNAIQSIDFYFLDAEGLKFFYNNRKNYLLYERLGNAAFDETQSIVFTEYSLNETSCQWNNIKYDEKAVIINSRSELEKYINCLNGAYPEIDFSRQTLLLCSGKTAQGIDEISQELIKAENTYVVKIGISLNDSAAIGKWILALVVDNKLDTGTNIDTNIVFLTN